VHGGDIARLPQGLRDGFRQDAADDEVQAFPARFIEVTGG
jgi:hypothetical protein